MKKDPEAIHLFAIELCERGRATEAVALLDLATAEHPDNAQLWNDFGVAQWLTAGATAARASLQAAYTLNPGDLSVEANFGRCLAACGEHERAVALLQGAPARADDTGAALVLADSLKEIWSLDAAQRLFRRLSKNPRVRDRAYAGLSEVEFRLGKTSAAVRHMREATALHPGRVRHSALARMLHFDPRASRAAILAEHRSWGELYARSDVERPRRKSRRKRLRVAFLSGIFIGHRAVFRPILGRGHSNRFEYVCLADAGVPAEWNCPHVDISSLTNSGVADLVRKMEVDILIECDGHYHQGARLGVFAARPAPVQISMPFYHGSLGLECIDFRITDNIVDPPGSESLYPERLLRLPDYMPFGPDGAPAKGPHRRSERSSILFGSFSATAKINQSVIVCWAAILRQVPGSRLLIQHYLDRHDRSTVNPDVRRQLEQAFRREGIGRDRLELRGALLEVEYRKLWREVDIALDPFPYNGTLSTLNALSQCVPVVTLAGSTNAGRVGMSLLSAARVPNLIGGDVAGYCRIAVELASDTTLRDRCRRRIRTSLKTSIRNDAAYVKNLEKAFLEAWESD